MPPTRTPYDPPPLAAPAILLEDARLIVAEKPAGLLSVPGRGPEKADCLGSRLRRVRPGALTVHRLDMETSGLVVFAKDREAQAALGALFETRRVEKAYEARVAGVPDTDEGEIDLPIAPDWPNRPRQKTSSEGRAAFTSWRKIAAEPDGARLALVPRTGRTHQLRVHLAAIGHPVLGDTLYTAPEAPPAPRLMLHATRLAFEHPFDARWIDVRSDAPF